MMLLLPVMIKGGKTMEVIGVTTQIGHHLVTGRWFNVHSISGPTIRATSLTKSNLRPTRDVGWKQWKHWQFEAMATDRWSWARVRSAGISNQTLAQAKALYCEVLPSNFPTSNSKANRELRANIETGGNRPILKRNINASSEYETTK